MSNGTSAEVRYVGVWVDSGPVVMCCGPNGKVQLTADHLSPIGWGQTSCIERRRALARLLLGDLRAGVVPAELPSALADDLLKQVDSDRLELSADDLDRWLRERGA